jgi:hypothetical protein
MRYSDKKMQRHRNKKIYTLRHFLFYMGVSMALGGLIGAAKAALDWSSGVTFAVGLVAGTITATMALREDLFEPAPPPLERHSHHV